MAQKDSNIAAGLDALLGSGKKDADRDSLISAQRQRRALNLGRPRNDSAREKHSKIRTSLVLDEGRYAKIREIALQNTLNINEIMDVAMTLVIESYERKYGPITLSESRISAEDVILSRKKREF